MTDPGTIYWGSYLLPFGEKPSPLTDSGVYVAGGDSTVSQVAEIGTLRSRYPGAREVGGPGSLIMPGLIDGHQHGRAATAQELGVRDEELETWLLEQRAMPRTDPALNARISAARSLLGGVTTLLHPHVTGNPQDPAAEAANVLRAFATSGARVVFGMDVRDRASFSYSDDDTFRAGLSTHLAKRVQAVFPAAAPADQAELDNRLAALRATAAGSLVRVALAPRGPQWCTDATLDWLAARLHEGTEIQIHCSETRAQFGYFLERGQTPVRFLAERRLLSPGVTLAHSVWLDEHDLEVLAESGASVAHNPSSNLRLGSGRAPVSRLRAAAVPVAIGTDSVGLTGRPDLFAEVRLARSLEQAPSGSFHGNTLAAFGLAAAAGARAAGMSDGVGALTPGMQADLVVLAAEPPPTAAEEGLRNDEAVVDLLLQGARAEHVTDVVVAGRQVVRDRTYLPFDLASAEQELAEQVKRAAVEPARREIVRQLRPYVDRERRRLSALTEGVDFVD